MLPFSDHTDWRIYGILLGFIVKPLHKFLPHVVTGTVVTTFGISLIPVGIRFVGGGVDIERTSAFGSMKTY